MLTPLGPEAFLAHRTPFIDLADSTELKMGSPLEKRLGDKLMLTSSSVAVTKQLLANFSLLNKEQYNQEAGMSLAPYLLNKHRSACRMKHKQIPLIERSSYANQA